MTLTRAELAELLGVQQSYLSPCNFNHAKNGAKEKGFNLISMQGRGKKATYEIEPLQELVLPGEKWKNLPIAPEYQISTLGRVKHPKGGILEGTLHRGYRRVRIADLGQLSVHRLVKLTFDPIDNPELYSVDHINGQRDDNRLENLRWCWQSENMEFRDENNTPIKEIVGQLIQKYGYEEAKNKLLDLLDEEK